MPQYEWLYLYVGFCFKKMECRIQNMKMAPLLALSIVILSYILSTST